MDPLRAGQAIFPSWALAMAHERERKTKQEFVVKAKDIGMQPEGNRRDRRKQASIARKRKAA